MTVSKLNRSLKSIERNSDCQYIDGIKGMYRCESFQHEAANEDMKL